MESKDVQQLFKDVLGSAERGEQPLNCVATGMEAGGAGQDPGRAQRPFLQGDLQLPGQGGCRWHSPKLRHGYWGEAGDLRVGGEGQDSVSAQGKPTCRVLIDAELVPAVQDCGSSVLLWGRTWEMFWGVCGILCCLGAAGAPMVGTGLNEPQLCPFFPRRERFAGLTLWICLPGLVLRRLPVPVPRQQVPRGAGAGGGAPQGVVGPRLSSHSAAL